MTASARMPWRWPSAALAVPALSYLAFEVWWLSANPGMPGLLRVAIVATLVVGVLRENKVAIPLWMLYCAFAALILFARGFRMAPSSTAHGMISFVAAATALTNAGFLFFFHPGSSTTNHGNR